MPVLHTHRLRSFVSRRTGENHSLDQQRSIDLLKKKLPMLLSVMEDPSSADDYFSTRTANFTKYGNFFERILMPDPNQTLLYWCRQQYSLMRVTELWSKLKLLGDGKIGVPSRSHHEVAFLAQTVAPPRGVIYLRPDLFFMSKINIEAFKGVTQVGNANHLERMSKNVAKPERHPWLAGMSLKYGSSKMSLMTENPMHIAVPTLEYGGVSDRFAFGSPDVMFLYGARGLAIQQYVDQFKVGPHPETMLHRYLCEAGVRIHVAPMYFARKRSSGAMQDPGAARQRELLTKQALAQWSTWLQGEPLSNDGHGNMTTCLVHSWWLPSPLARAG